LTLSKVETRGQVQQSTCLNVDVAYMDN